MLSQTIYGRSSASYFESVFLLLFDNDILQRFGHVHGQRCGVVVEVGNPAVDLVQLQEDARRTLVVRIVVLLRALVEVLDVDVAHLAGWRRSVVFAVVDVLTAAGRQTGCLVHYRLY